MSRPPPAVVVTGAGAVCSIAPSRAGLAEALRSGRTGFTSRPLTDQGLLAVAPLAGFDLEAALQAKDGLPEPVRSKARRLAGRAPLPVQAALVAALEAWHEAGLFQRALPAEDLAVVVAGTNLNGRYLRGAAERFEASPLLLSPRAALHLLDTDHVGILSHVLGIRGEGFSVGGASASGNLAIINGARLIERGAMAACLVVGAMTDLSDAEIQCFVNVGAMARPGPEGLAATVCRPFDEARRGFVYGQGAAALVLERASPSTTSRARLAGHAFNLDGNSQADPDEDGEARAMGEALARAGLAPEQVSYVNSHGTSSPRGDEVEIRALRRTFGSAFPRPWVNSSKGLFGHTLSAAGVLEAVAVLCQLEGDFVHANPHLERPLDGDCRFAGRQAEPARIEHALSNGFGFGGINSSVVFSRT